MSETTIDQAIEKLFKIGEEIHNETEQVSELKDKEKIVDLITDLSSYADGIIRFYIQPAQGPDQAIKQMFQASMPPVMAVKQMCDLLYVLQEASEDHKDQILPTVSTILINLNAFADQYNAIVQMIKPPQEGGGIVDAMGRPM